MNKNFYQYLFNLRASGQIHSTEENARLLSLVTESQGSGSEVSISAAGTEIHGKGIDGEVGSLSNQTLINYRNGIICVATGMVFYAMDWHVNQEKAHVLCDYYINLAETIRNAEDFNRISRELFRDFQELFSEREHISYGRTIDACIEYIDQKLYSGITVQEVADQMGYSPEYLTTLFKKKTGKSMYTYISEEKIQEARTLLLCTRQPLTSIASALGYHSLSHFSKAFKKAEGITPSEYRKTDGWKREKYTAL
jgi:AraC-like DNA-binding protein